MQNLKLKPTEPRLYSFIVSPMNLHIKKDMIQFDLDPKIIPQSVCNIIAYDLDGAGNYIKNLIQGKPLQAKHTNSESLSDFLKLSEQFIETPQALPTMIVSPQVEPSIKASGENWEKYLRDESKKIGYRLVKQRKV